MSTAQEAGAMKQAGLEALTQVQSTLKNLVAKVGGAKKRLRKRICNYCFFFKFPLNIS